ncbi:MAG: VWA domain-containing protein [Betaproteobacteria bacterium]
MGADPSPLLEALARELWLPGLICSSGQPEARLAHLAHWWDRLLAGEMPDRNADLGDPPVAAALRQAVAGLQLSALTRGSPETTLQLLRTALWHADRLIDRHEAQARSEAILAMADAFRAEWAVERADWEEAQALLQSLGEGAHLHWDALKGHLRSRAWHEARRLAGLMAQRAELAALLRRVGRMQRPLTHAHHRPAPRDAVSDPQPPTGLKPVETVLPDAPGELRGIRLGDRLERLLGSELQQLRHPVLHKWWRARKAEARLLTYDSQAQLVDWRPDPQATPRHRTRPAANPPLERGPLLICLDTSGSMQGAPESIAKAVVLEATRVAQHERRGCIVMAFGGPDEVIERELDFSPEGFNRLMELIGQGFDGGTDVQTPIERAIARVHERRWASADVLIVSDGEFGCTPATLEHLDRARTELGLRVFGLLIGDRETMGLLEVADEIHWVRDWRRDAPPGMSHGSGGAGFSPVHSKSLTALFFPNALSERAARHARGLGPPEP